MPILSPQSLTTILASVPFSALHYLSTKSGNESEEHVAEIARDEVLRRLCVLLKANLGEHRDPLRFLDALESYNAVISGDFVATLIDPLHREQYTHVDIFVDYNKYWAFVRHMEHVEDCHIGEQLRYIPGLHRDGFDRADELTSTTGCFRLIRSPCSSPLYSIPYFYSTHLMNYLSRDHMSIAYPQLTFHCEGIQSFPSALPSSFKVEPRNTLFHNVNGCTPFFTCGGRPRMFDDEFSAITYFRDSFASHGTVVWKLGGEPCDETCPSDSRSVFSF